MPTLNFKGKSEIHSHHLGVPFCDLRIDKKKSFANSKSKSKWTPSLDDHLIIHGDNLYALKALLPQYASRVKCIYIDPPYNTGNENWKYNDNVNSPLIKEWLHKIVDSDDLERHDKWLCMMWPRLHLLKELLAEDGVIFISIGSDEVNSLTVILNEIFNVEKPLATFIWKKRSGVNDSKDFISEDHDYVICYRKTNKFIFRGNKNEFSNYSNPDKDPRGPWTKGDLTCNKTKQERPNLFFSIKDPKTGISYKCNPNRVWRTNKEGMKKLIKDNKVLFPQNKDKDGVPTYKRHFSEVRSDRKPVSTFIEGETLMNKIFQEGKITMKSPMNSQATKEIQHIFSSKVFDHPKPKNLIKNLISQATLNDDIILDSFAGSGTTAHAVLELNKEDHGNRKFILVECEDYAHRITAERVRRVIKGVPQLQDPKLQTALDGSFTYCTLGDEITEETLLKGNNLPSYEVLVKYVFYTATGQVIDKVKENKDFYVTEIHGDTAFFVIYKPDKEFLRSDASALHLDRKRRVQEIMQQKKCNKAIVFASACFYPPEELSDEKITFTGLPFAIHRIVGV